MPWALIQPHPVYAGINLGKTIFLAFCISGLVSGLCGYLWVSRYVIGSVEVAKGYELSIIAACVIGGVSIAGGIGSVAGTVLGALFLGLVNSALPSRSISHPFGRWQFRGRQLFWLWFSMPGANADKAELS